MCRKSNYINTHCRHLSFGSCVNIQTTMISTAIFPAACFVLLVSYQPVSACWGGRSTSPEDRLTHATAASKLSGAGISIASSGGCSDRNRRTCTSLETIRRKCIDDLIWFKGLTGCTVIVTGGTETGHSSGTKSHWNGYKIDIRLNSCVNNYIESKFTYIGVRGDGARQYRDSRGNVYAKESNHWDILYQ